MAARRLRTGEWLAALGAALLLVSLFALQWYRGIPILGWWSYPPLGHSRANLLVHVISVDGWHAIPTLRWFVVATILAGIAVAVAQAAIRAPALPVTLDMLGMLVAGLTTILLAIRLATTDAPLRFGAIVGLFAAGLTAFGSFRAYRAEQGWTPDPDDPARRVELVELGPSAERT